MSTLSWAYVVYGSLLSSFDEMHGFSIVFHPFQPTSGKLIQFGAIVTATAYADHRVEVERSPKDETLMKRIFRFCRIFLALPSICLFAHWTRQAPGGTAEDLTVTRHWAACLLLRCATAPMVS